jgi:hypothetical protein
MKSKTAAGWSTKRQLCRRCGWWAKILRLLISASIALVADPLATVDAALTTPTAGVPAPVRLQQLLREYSNEQHDTPLLLPCCYDGLTARLVARANFQATFLTGFGASAVHGVPDAQLLSYEEMRRTCDTVAEALDSVAVEQNTHQHRDDASGSRSSSTYAPIPCIAVRCRQS